MPATAAPGFDPIQHVVVLMLENRSYDEILGGLFDVLPDADGVRPAAPGMNRDPEGRTYVQAPTANNRVDPDPMHNHEDVMEQMEGGNAGFVHNYGRSFPESNALQRAEVMGYFPRGFLRAAHALAEQFAVCDRWFSSVPGPTWTNRFFLLSGTSIGRVAMPEGIFKPNLHLYSQDTIFDRLNERGISWRVYHGDFPLSLLLTHQLRYRNLRRYRFLDRFAQDARGASFPQFVFIEPKYMGRANDDHPPHDSQAAQELVAHVYETLRRNTALWNRTLLIVTYDEHGGFYDHVVPPSAIPPDNHREEYVFDRLGVRVPTVFASPWLVPQVVHQHFDHTSVLKYLAEKWRLRPLGRRMEAAANPWLSLTKSAAPRTDTPVTIGGFARHRAYAIPTARPVNEAQTAMLAFSSYLEQQTPPHLRLHLDRLAIRADEAEQIVIDRLRGFMAARVGAAGG